MAAPATATFARLNTPEEADVRPAAFVDAPPLDAAQETGISRLEEAMNTIGARVGSLSVSIADTAGAISDVAGALSGQAGDLHRLGGDIREMSESNRQVARAADSAAESANTTREGLGETTQSIHAKLSLAVEDIRAMAKSASEIAGILQTIRRNIAETQTFSGEIRNIATQTQMLAINAGIMAARAGEEGRGFGVIAVSVKELADRTGSVTKNIVDQLDSLASVVGTLADQNARNEEIAAGAYERSVTIDGEMARFAEFGKAVDGMIDDIQQIAAPVAGNLSICENVLERMSALDGQVQESSQKLAGASRQIDGLVSFGEDLIGHVADSGVETEDSPLIRHCIAGAEEVARLFEEALAGGRISLGQLFDENYRAIPNTNPQQVLTGFTDLTDRLLPPLQEAMLEVDPRVVFCAAVDRNGYLPTHNRKYSHRQGDDPV